MMAFLLEPANLLASAALLAGALGAIYGYWAHSREQKKVRAILSRYE